MTRHFHFLQLGTVMDQETDQQLKTPNLQCIREIVFEVVIISIIIGSLVAVFLLFSGNWIRVPRQDSAHTNSSHGIFPVITLWK